MNITFKYKGRSVQIFESIGHDDFPFFDAYVDGKWRTCGWEDMLDIETKVEQLIDAEDFGELSRAAFGPSSSRGAGK